MAHYAKVVNGIVEKVIVADADFIANFKDDTPGEWIQTSYNTRGNKHYTAQGVDDSAVNPPLRGNYAGAGFVYDEVHDVFYIPRPFPSWSLNQSTWTWVAPTPYPTDNRVYRWDEPSLSWVELVSITPPKAS